MIEASLPGLQELVGATAVLVAARSADGPVLTATVGQSLPVGELVLPAESAGLAPVEVPAAWAAVGIRTAFAQVLPGLAGTQIAFAATEGSSIEKIWY